MGKHFIDPKSSEICQFFKFFIVRRKLTFFGPRRLPALYLKKPWYPCPFEILEETLMGAAISRQKEKNESNWTLYLRMAHSQHQHDNNE
jgi:hypothetical protein